MPAGFGGGLTASESPEVQAWSRELAGFLATVEPAKRAEFLHRLSVLGIQTDLDLGTYSLGAIAEAYSLNPKTLQREIGRGNLRAAKLGKEYRVTKNDLLAWVELRKSAQGKDL